MGATFYMYKKLRTIGCDVYAEGSKHYTNDMIESVIGQRSIKYTRVDRNNAKDELLDAMRSTFIILDKRTIRR